MKNILSLREKFYFLNIITKESPINKIFFKRENISLKSSSVQKPEIKNLKKYRDFYIQRDKNEISNDIKLKKYDTKKISNQTLNIGNIDTKNNLKSKEKDFLINEKSNNQKDDISNDSSGIFINNLNTNEKYGLNNLFKEDDNDDNNERSYENINSDEFREESNIKFCGGFFSDKNSESSLSINDDKTNEKKEKKKQDEISNNLNIINENEDNYFENDSFFGSQKQKNKNLSNKSSKSDSKIENNNNINTHSNESVTKILPIKIFFLKSLIFKIKSEKKKVLLAIQIMKMMGRLTKMILWKL